MLKLDKYKEFEWDRGNIDKSYKKHGITPNQAEEVLLDEKAIVLRDFKHSQNEERYALIGATFDRKILFIVFTLRDKKIRIISARLADRKEENKYAK